MPGGCGLEMIQWLKSAGFGLRYKAAGDLVLGVLSIIMVAAIEIKFDVGDHFFPWAAQYEDLEADELPFILLWVSVTSIWFAGRRFKEVRVEYEAREGELTARKRVEVQLREHQTELEKLVEQRTRQIENEIAARLAAEENLRRQQAELARINRLSTTSEMVAALAHELYQPLFALNSYAQGCVELLNSGADKTDELLGALGRILEQSKRATRNIVWIREFVEKAELRPESVDLNRVVADVAELLEAEGRRHSVPVEISMTPALPRVNTHPIQMQQVLVNLAANGMAAMSEQPRAGQPLKISTVNHDDSAVEIQVQDSGAGLKDDMLEKVFEPFYTTKDEGLGMGLSICRSILAGFGGQMWATSDGSSGTTFHAKLPAIGEAGSDGR